eukprot:353616-Chlamydomonas_euryale.AAC.2
MHDMLAQQYVGCRVRHSAPPTSRPLPLPLPSLILAVPHRFPSRFSLRPSPLPLPPYCHHTHTHTHTNKYLRDRLCHRAPGARVACRVRHRVRPHCSADPLAVQRQLGQPPGHAASTR